jgi:alginate O-acetyltransferase complex protein AlgI
VRFNSIIYWLFLAVVVVAVWVIPQRARKWSLLVASYAFYASWHWPYLLLLIGATAFNHRAVRWIISGPAERKPRGRWVITANLLLLALFKYLDWLVGQLNLAGSVFGAEWSIPLPRWVLPLGISFYLFECISYVVDVVRKREKAHDFWDFQLYVAFFPHLIAGPILRVKELLPQLGKLGFDARKVESGLWVLVIGLFVKIVLADGLAPSVDVAFARETATLRPLDVWVMASAFGLQIYLDFSAYSLIALGSARLCGVELVQNFQHPYSARSPVDFWNRWHMSLSRWIRDYVFYPLVGSKPTKAALCRAALISMTLCGLWHGAGWTFVLWGAYQGVLVAGHHLVGARTNESAPVHAVWQVPLTFALVALGWLFFRAETAAQAFQLVGTALAPWRGLGRSLSGTFYLHTAALLAAVWCAPWLWKLGQRGLADTDTDASRRSPAAAFRGLAAGIMLALCLVYLRGKTAFIYFQF